MKATIKLDIVSLEAKIFSGYVEMVIVTGVMGELGVMFGHMPLLTSIKPGQIRITMHGGKEEVYYVSGGIMEVQPTVATILADTVIHAADIDEAAALAARESAKRVLSEKTSKINFAAALAEVAQATAKLQTINLARRERR